MAFKDKLLGYFGLSKTKAIEEPVREDFNWATHDLEEFISFVNKNLQSYGFSEEQIPDTLEILTKLKSYNKVPKEDKLYPDFSKAVVGNIPEKSSVPNGLSVYNIRTGYISTERPYSDEMYKSIIKLVATNPYFGKVHSQFDNLANKDYLLFINNSYTREKFNQFTDFIHQEQYKWFNGGFFNLQSVLGSQLLCQGAASVEICPIISNGRVVKLKIKTPNPYTIDIEYDDKLKEFKYLQNLYRVTNTGYSLIKNEYIELNTNFYAYHPLHPIGDNLYGVPTFAKAMATNPMVANLERQSQEVAEKFSILGVITANIKPPLKMPSEKLDEYTDRVQKFVNEMIPTIVKGYKSGILVGLHNQAEYNATNVVGDISSFDVLNTSAKNLHIAALESYASFFNGDIKASSEVVTLMKTDLAATIDHHNKIITRQLEFALNTLLKFTKYSDVGYVRVVSQESALTDKLRTEQARTVELTNSKLAYDMGYASQNEAAQSAGFSYPDLDEPRTPTGADMKSMTNPSGINITGKPSGTNAAKRNITGTKPADEKTAKVKKNLKLNLKETTYYFEDSFADEYLNFSECSENLTKLNFSVELGKIEDLDELEKYFKKYLLKTQSAYSQFASSLANVVYEKLAKNKNSSLEEMKLEGLKILNTVYNDSFKTEWNNAIINSIYDNYRANKESMIGHIPKELLTRTSFSFDIIDEQTKNYFATLDRLYFEKSIKDKASLEAYFNLIEKYHVSGTVVLEDLRVLAEFRQAVKEFANEQDWKLIRIIKTTVNRIRNNATLRAMNEAGAKTYIIQEVMDKKTCKYCRKMDGKEFPINVALDKINKEFTAYSLEDLSETNSFINKVYQNPEDIPSDVASLMSAGIIKPPFHNSCRGWIVVGTY
jgi:SPP1 gp7 family putative phage head morphogenesis protein